MRVRVVAGGILVLAIVDLILVLMAPIAGWVPSAATASQTTIVALALALLLALLAIIGCVSVLATDFADDARVFVFDPHCGECGRSTRHALAFCDRCGASG